MFQSPRSGKFVSNGEKEVKEFDLEFYCFNPLDRGNLYLINAKLHRKLAMHNLNNSFNPLDRGNLYLMTICLILKEELG